MTDQETNRKLALAIGWRPEDMRSTPHDLFLMDRSRGPYFHAWEVFNYRDWRVAGPIAQRYDCFPFNSGNGWCAYAESVSRSVYSDTPQKAIALAVIAAHEAGQLPTQSAPGG